MTKQTMEAEIRAGRGATVRSLRVWDLPTRLFHWSLATILVVSIYTGNVGGLREMRLHMLAGFAILALVLFRIAWGFVGSHYARFTQFVRGPRAVAGYLRQMWSGEHPQSIGHNPLGALSVLAMLASLLLQATSGLFARDDIITEGPLAKFVSQATSDLLTRVHEFNAVVLYTLVGIHLAAVLAYLAIGGQNLIRPMLTGRKPTTTDAAQADAGFASVWLALLVFAAAVAAVWTAVTW